MTIDAVLFDLDDTLHDDSRAYRQAAEDVAREVSASHGVDVQRLRDAYVREAEAFWRDLSTTALEHRLAIARRTMWGSALAACGLDDPDLAQRCGANYNAYRKKYLELFPGAAGVLHALRERGLKIGLITNGFAETHHEKIDLLGVRASFDTIVIADEVGMLKPDPEIFRHAARELGTQPQRAAMVGDRYDRDVIGALETGMFAVWLNLYDAPVPPGKPEPDAQIRSIDEVLGVLPLAEQPAGQ